MIPFSKRLNLPALCALVIIMGIVASIIFSNFKPNPRQRLLRSIRGCTFVIPDLEETFTHWPQDINPEVNRLAEDVDRRLQLFFPGGKIARKLQDAGVAVFAASWWPYASLDRLCIVTYLSLWLFAWDDETDSTEISDMIHNHGRGATFRHQTKEFIHTSLSNTHDEWKKAALPGSHNLFIANFGAVGRAIVESYNPEQINRFLHELDLFLDMTDLEQRVQCSNKLPTVEEYSRRRMGSSAVGVCLALTEYAYAMEIPPSVMNEELIHRLWDLTNIIISTTNDIMSVKKEIDQDQTDSLIPLLYVQYGSLQKAIDVAAQSVSSSVAEFDQVSDQVLNWHFENEGMRANLKRFIDGCKYACTANLNWGLISKRYKLPSQSLKGGLHVTL